MNRKSQKEIQVTTHMVRQFLQENEDTGYRFFHSNLLPGVDNVMGNDASRIGECLCKDGMQRTLNICGKICAGH